MAGIIPAFTRHKRRQPLGPQSINWALPITQSLEFAIIDPTIDKQDLAYGRTVNTASNAFGRNWTEYGDGLYSNAELNRSVSYNVPVSALDKPFTLVIGYHIHVIPTASRVLCGNFINSTSGFRINVDTANFIARFGRAGASQVLTGSAVSVGSKIDAVIADASTFYYYENGSLSVSAAQAGFVASTDLFKLGGSNTPISTISFCYLFSRALSANEVRQLYEEPYKIIVPSARVIQLSVPRELGGDIIGPSAEISGEINHFAPSEEPGSFLLGGDIVGPSAEISGSVSHYSPASVGNHGISATLEGNCTAEMSGTLLRSTPYTPPPPPEPSQAFGGFWDLPTGQRRSERLKALKQKESELVEQEIEIELNQYPDSVNMLATIQDNKAAILEQIMAIQAEQEAFKQEFNIKARLLLLN